jgi:hypothetical protein
MDGDRTVKGYPKLMNPLYRGYPMNYFNSEFSPFNKFVISSTTILIAELHIVIGIQHIPHRSASKKSTKKTSMRNTRRKGRRLSMKRRGCKNSEENFQ